MISLEDSTSLKAAGLLTTASDDDALSFVDPQSGTTKILAMVIGLVAAGALDAAEVRETLRTKTVSGCVFKATITPRLTGAWLKLLNEAVIIGNQGVELASAIVSTVAFLQGQKLKITPPETLPHISAPSMVRRFRPGLTPGLRQLAVLALLGQPSEQIAGRISAWNWNKDSDLILLIERSRLGLAKRLVNEWSLDRTHIVSLEGKKGRRHRINLNALTSGKDPESIVCIIDAQLEPSPGAILSMKIDRAEASALLPTTCGPIFLRASCKSDLVFEADGSIAQINVAKGSFYHYDARRFGWQEAQE